MSYYIGCCWCKKGSGSSGGSGSGILGGCCPGVASVATLTGTVISTTGTCNCVPTSISLTLSTSYTWDHSRLGFCDIDVHLVCTNGIWQASSQAIGANLTQASSVQCSPFQVQITLAANPSDPNTPCLGNITYVFTV